MNALFENSPVMAILRGLSTADSVRLAHAAWDLGVKLVEVPIQNLEAERALSAVSEAAQERGALAGAGTVTSVEQVRFAHRAGAAFTVAPGIDEAVSRESAARGLPHLPGVATATEIQKAKRLGHLWVKAFPADSLGTPWFRALKSGPFPEMRFVATGGINADNAEAFLRSGAECVAVGSALEDPEQLTVLARLMERSHTETKRVSVVNRAESEAP